MKKRITDGIEVMEKVLNSYPEFHENVAEQRLGIQVSRAIYEARVAAGLSQKELAAKIGTHQSAISRLESSDYDQHSLATLYKIADALGARVEVRIVPTSSGEARLSGGFSEADQGAAPFVGDAGHAISLLE